jgi:hypothetical protein
MKDGVVFYIRWITANVVGWFAATSIAGTIGLSGVPVETLSLIAVLILMAFQYYILIPIRSVYKYPAWLFMNALGFTTAILPAGVPINDMLTGASGRYVYIVTFLLVFGFMYGAITGLLLAVIANSKGYYELRAAAVPVYHPLPRDEADSSTENITTEKDTSVKTTMEKITEKYGPEDAQME